MDKKAIVTMLKLYEKQCDEKEPDSFTDISSHFLDMERIYQTYVLIKNTVAEQVDKWRLLYRFPLSHFIYLSFKNADIKMLHNTLYQNACWNQMEHASWGIVPESMFHIYIIPLLAAYKTDTIDLVIPKEWGLCERHNLSGGIQTNLLMAIWYDNQKLKVQGKLQSEKFLTKKHTKKDIDTVLYLLALLDENIEQASKHLNAVCIDDRASKDFGVTKFDRSLSIYTHALYNLGQIVYDGKFAGKIEKPIQPNFSLELALYQESLPMCHGDLVIIYDEPYTFINQITLTPPPKMERVQPYIDGQPWNVLETLSPSKEEVEKRYGADHRIKKSKEYYINCEKYNETATQLVLQRL